MTHWAMMDRFLDGDRAEVDDETEAGWHTHWHAAGLGALSPVEMSVGGGLSARSLPQVFIAGYQAALHQTFPDLPDTGWAAFVAAEDTRDTETFPGTRLLQTAGGFAISGHKSWVGQSRHVQHLRVTAMLDDTVRVVSVNSQVDGLTLTHREQPRFLSGLSQGFAAFDNAVVDDMLPTFDLRSFGRTEPQFVMLAGAAFLAAHASETGVRDRALALVSALAAYCLDQHYAPRTFAALDRELTMLANQFDGADVTDWQADRKLLSMYSPRIQKRA